MYNYAMVLQYDGTRYSGWQRQGNTANTIQYKLETALSNLLSEEIEVSGSGRTDAGVHALGQTANFHCEKKLNCADFIDVLNRKLPEDICVMELKTAPQRFHARLSAVEKTYRYTILNSAKRDVFQRKYLLQMEEKLDLNAMRGGAECMLGTHDFYGFSSGHTKKSTIRTIRAIDIAQNGDKIEISFTGDGFLYNMVRILTGTLIELGLGKRSSDSIAEVFDTRDRQKAGYTVPPQGLCLMKVYY